MKKNLMKINLMKINLMKKNLMINNKIISKKILVLEYNIMINLEEKIKNKKIIKYCYKINQISSQIDVKKANNYFNHLKHHVMIGGKLSNANEDLLIEINKSIQIIINLNKELTNNIEENLKKEDISRQLKEEILKQKEKLRLLLACKDIYQNKSYLDEKINEGFISEGTTLDANTKKKIIPFNDKEYYLDKTKFSVYYSNDNTHYYLIKNDTLIVTMGKYYILEFTLSNSDEVCQEHLFMVKK
jgi:hypothetical protein